MNKYHFNFPKLPAVYKFTNKVNGKIYIGKSTDLRRRMYSHFRSSLQEKASDSFVRALIKYGFDSFKIEVIELFPKRSNFIDLYIMEREKFWIGFFQSQNESIGYNLLSADMRIGFTMSEETKKKIGAALKGRPSPMRGKKGVLNPCFGQKLSEETKRKMAEGMERRIEKDRQNGIVPRRGRKYRVLNYKYIPPTPETRKKMIEQSVLATRKRIAQIDNITGEVIKIWNSLSEAALFFTPDKPYNTAGISHCLAGRLKTAFGFKWALSQPSLETEEAL